MRAVIPEKIVELCDICEREGYLSKCKACGKMYCLTCEAIIIGCIHEMDVCIKCGNNERVNAIAQKYAPLILSVLKKRDKELLKLGKVKDEIQSA